MLHSLARGRAAARRVGHVPELPRRDLQDVGVAQPRRREDSVGVAQRVQVLHPRLPPPLAPPPRGAKLRREVSVQANGDNGQLRPSFSRVASRRPAPAALAGGVPLS